MEEKNRIRLPSFFDARDGWIILAANAALLALWLTGTLSGWITLLAWLVAVLIHTNFLSRRFSFRKVPSDLYRAIPALLMPLMVIVLARGGIVTPTEISVFAVVYALLVGAVIYRDLTFSTILRCILTTGMMTGVIMLVIMGSSVLQ